MSVTRTRSAPARSRVAAALLLLGAAAYTAWVLELVLVTGLDPVQAYVSGLAAAGLVPATHAAHAVSSSCAMAGALAALALLTFAARRDDRWPALGRLGPPLVLAELAATFWTLASVAAFTAGRGTWALGAGQRLQVLLVALYVALLARCVGRPGAAAPPGPPAARPSPRPERTAGEGDR
ncbi:hypothetical protein [Streptomyces lydicus]|uniref:hypothetical protein n=1 Tax=Streptomyces lydicus TaxID=47763 RepID=UPI00342AB29D